MAVTAIAIVAILFIFFAPIISTHIPRESVYGYGGGCTSGPHSFDPVQAHVSVSYISFGLIPPPNLYART